MMESYDNLIKKWAPVLNEETAGPIESAHKRAVTAAVLENTEKAIREQGEQASMMTEDAAANNTSVAANWNPVLISLVRRAMPNMMAYDVCGVQPMSGPTGLIFAMRSRYTSQTGTEALFNEADTSFSAIGGQSANTSHFAGVANGALGTTQTGTDPNDRASGSGYTYHTGMTTAAAEALGDSASNSFAEMAFSIEKVAVTAVSRALKAEYTMELAQDLKAVHGLDAETELSNILSAEILAEINREVVRTINYSAVAGATKNTAASGTFNLDTDSNGRWAVEKFKGLMFQIERDANELAKATRRGKGNVLITSSDVASALQMAGVLDYAPALNNSLNVDDTGNTFAGVLNGRIKVYIDPYFNDATNNYYTIGYKGTNAFDAGIFYCPYVPLQMVRAVGENTFQPKIGFKTRYGMVANPYATNAADGVAARVGSGDGNKYYRLVKITNLM